MTSEECRLLVLQYLAGQLTPMERVQFEARLSSDAALRLELEELRAIWQGLDVLPEEVPSPAMRARFYQRLNALERGHGRQGGSWFAGWNWRALAPLAAGLLLFAAGMYVGRSNVSAQNSAQQTEQLRSEVQNLRQVVALSLLDRQSAASRLEGLAWSSRVERPDSQLIAALLSALNHDPNTNVRLSSVDALQRFSDDSAIRKALLDSLSSQDSPLVQIALIDALVQVRGREAGRQLQRLAMDNEINAAVRQRAKWGADKLKFQ